MCLKKWRPDLKVAVVDVPPSGLAIITGLDPASTVLTDNYPRRSIEQYVDLPFKYLEEQNRSEALNVVANDWDKVQTMLPDRRRKFFSVSLLKSRRVLSAAIRSASPKPRGRTPSNTQLGHNRGVPVQGLQPWLDELARINTYHPEDCSLVRAGRRTVLHKLTRRYTDKADAESDEVFRRLSSDEVFYRSFDSTVP